MPLVGFEEPSDHSGWFVEEARHENKEWCASANHRLRCAAEAVMRTGQIRHDLQEELTGFPDEFCMR